MVNTERLCMGCMNDNGGEKICPICGHDSAADNSAQYLSIGTWLNDSRYLIGKVIEENGDSVVYIAWDNNNNTVVNVTEYLPAGIARRSADRLTVGPNDTDGLAFNRGKTEFTELHTLLSKVRIAGVLPVTDVFESNGTVYSVCKAVSCISLKDFLIRNGGVLKWEQIKPLFIPLLTTLNDLHNVGIVHRGISPENILVGRDGRLYFSGFSIKAARCANTDFAYKLYAGFSAPEQYDVEAETGFASDIYAMGAVLFRCVIGSVPPDAKERIVNDKLSIPANAAENVSRGALAAIANALKIDPFARTASADRFKKMIEATSEAVPAETANETPKKKKSNVKYVVIASLVTALFFVVIFGGLALFMDFDKFLDNGDANSSNISDTSSNYEPVFPQVNIKYNDNGIEVTDWSGKTYSELVTELKEQNVELEIIIIGKVYSDTFAKGQIVDQTVKTGKIEPNSEIGVYISLGKSTLIMPEIIGVPLDKAKGMLFEAGFSSENIFFRERYSDKTPGTVTASTVKPRETVSADEKIIIDYCPEAENADDSQGNGLTGKN